MTEKELKYVSDILSAIQYIEEFISDTNTFEEYVNDVKTQSAVERQLAIIGEAVNKFNGLVEAVKIKNAAKIVSVRNRLVHAYDAIDNSIIWLILKKYIPELKNELKDLV